MNKPVPDTATRRFHVLAPLAAGGHGTVHLARQLDSSRKVVIKVLAKVDDPVELARFLQEAEIARQLTHPCLVRALDHQADEHGAWIAYEHVDGASLRARLDAGPLPWAHAVALAHDVASGLAAAHAAGILHRDVKPENLLLEGTRCRVTDFGVAKLTAGTFETQAGVIVGTPGYVSPEQVRGEVATAQSDLYALGITLFEMITGQTPFHGRKPVDLLVAHARERPPRAAALCPEIPNELDDLILRCLAKDPDARPHGAAALAEELEAIARLPPRTHATLADAAPATPAPDPAPPPAPPRVAARPSIMLTMTRRPLLGVVGAALAAGLLAGALLHLRTAAAARPARVAAVGGTAATSSAGPNLSSTIPEIAMGVDAAIAELAELEPQVKHNEVIGATAIVDIDLEQPMAMLLRVLGSYDRLEDRLAGLDRRLEDADEGDPARPALAARLSGARLEAWLYRSWLDRYRRCFENIRRQPGDTHTSLMELMEEVSHHPFMAGGAPQFDRFGARVYSLLERVAQRRVPFDRAVGTVLIQGCSVSRIRRRAPKQFAEADRRLPREMERLAARCREATSLSVLGPLSADLMSLGASLSHEERTRLATRIGAGVEAAVKTFAGDDAAAQKAIRDALSPVRQEVDQPRASR